VAYFLRMTARSAKRILAIVEASIRLFVRLFVCPFICHTVVLCQNDTS